MQTSRNGLEKYVLGTTLDLGEAMAESGASEKVG
jgi:hypothetical protein